MVGWPRPKIDRFPAERRKAGVIVFLLIVLAVYALANYYVARRGAKALAAYTTARRIFLAVFIALALTFPLGRVLMALTGKRILPVLLEVGVFHLLVMLYGVLAAGLIDLVRLVNAFFPFFPKAWTARPGRTGLVLFIAAAGTIALALTVGATNAGRLKTTEIEIRFPKRAGTMDTLNVVLASDFHLSSISGKKRLARTVSLIDSLDPDIVLLAGDIVDESVSEQEEAEFSRIMAGIRAPLGVYAVAGNHESYAGLETALDCLRGCGIIVLEDEAVAIAESFILAGRRDRQSLGYQERRKSIPAILAPLGPTRRLPVILLDHQPGRLEEAKEAGVDLQLSGHTHDGQVFPINLINTLIWELNYGYLRKDGTQYYVTSGVGTWGPPVRIGSTAEVVRIRIVFDESALVSRLVS